MNPDEAKRIRKETREGVITGLQGILDAAGARKQKAYDEHVAGTHDRLYDAKHAYDLLEQLRYDVDLFMRNLKVVHNAN